MKILVTGAAGFIGSHSAERLKDIGFDVTGLDNFSNYYDVKLKQQNEKELLNRGIKMIHADLLINKIYNGLPTDFDYIFHFAAQPGISADVTFNDYLKNNFIATSQLLDFALKNKELKLFVNISTSSVYGINATHAETFVPQPASLYGVTKLAAEQLVMSYTRMGMLNACSLRLYSVYGPRERPDKLYTKLITSILLNKPFTLYEGSNKHLRSFTYVEDIVDGIVSVIGKEDVCTGEIFNIGSDVEYSTEYGMNCVKEIMQNDIILKILPGRMGEQLHTKANISKANKILGYQPSTNLPAGLKSQVEWCKKYFNK